jgi:hypothetical protein
MSEHHDHEPDHAASPTDHVLSELQLYGYRPFADEPDPRELPDGNRVAGAIADIFDALISTLEDTRLEPDLDDLLWSTVNLFHRATERIERELDDNEQAQRRSQREQDGSEVKSVELERLTAEGQTLIERRDAFELMRDQAAEQFERQTRSSWRPRSGSMVNHRHLTSAMIDSRDFLAAKKRAETQVMLPAGPKIAFTGGLDFNDHRLIWAISSKASRRSIRSTPSTPTWCCCTAVRPKAPNASHPVGRTIARCRRWRSSPTGPGTPRLRPSSATI